MTTAFVLTGGGSLGAVQVGMLQALAEHGIQPDLLVGTSCGAMNAAWVAGHGMSRDSLTELAAVWTRPAQERHLPRRRPSGTAWTPRLQPRRGDKPQTSPLH